MNGFINVIKPVGATASDVVVCLKHILKEKKIGHLGTLDPGASGVLPIAVGGGTKLFNFLTDKEKKYRAFFTFGKTTDTLDSYGKLTENNGTVPAKEQLNQVIERFVGEFDQIPPQYSAKSINGVRAYKLARSGTEVELKPRRISIFDIRLISQVSSNTFMFDITCGGGTYIRSIARDIAAELNTVAYMSGLIRIKSGNFDIETAYTLDEIRERKSDCLLSVMYPLADVNEYLFEDRLYNDIDCGRAVNCPFNDGLRKVYCKGVFFGLGQNVDGRLKIVYYLKNSL